MSKVEFVIFSDFHAHNFKAYSRFTNYAGGFYNSRLVDSLEVLAQIRQYCVEHRISEVLFGGDLFHARQAVRTDVLNTVLNEMIAFDYEGIHVYMIPGNHDYANKRGNVHSLAVFSRLKNTTVISYSASTVMNISGAVLSTIPYTDSLEEARENLQAFRSLLNPYDTNILLAHLGMQGARVGSDYVLVSDGDIGVSDVPQDTFTACFFGHFHEHQKLFKNGWVIGATHEHNWGDSGGSRGFLHVTIESGKVSVKQIPTEAPRFRYVYTAEDISDLRERDIVRCPTTLSDENKESIREKITNIGFLEEITAAVTAPDASFSTESLNPNDMLEEWIEAQDTKLPTEDLLSLGKELLAEATKDE